MKNLLLPLVLVIIHLNSYSQNLHWITPSNGHNHINDLSFVSATEGFAVCDDGVILKFSNGTWTKMQSPTSVDLTAVDALSSTQALACGNNGIILKLSGNTWTEQETPDNRLLSDINYMDESNACAVGEGILFYDGLSWNDAGIGSQLQCVDFLNSEEGWAAGYGQLPVLMHYSDGSWTQDYSLQESELVMFDDITIINPQLVRLTGHTIEGDARMYEYNGTTWEEVDGDPNNGSSFYSAETGYGISNPYPMGYTEPPAIYKYSNGLWAVDHYGLSTENYTSVQSIDNEAFVSSSDGFVYNGSNNNWTITNGFTADNILDISFTSDHNGYFACGLSGVWHYEGGTWDHELIIPGFTFNVIESIEYEVWAACYKEIEGFHEVRIYKKTGDSWELWPSPYELYYPVTSLTGMIIYTSGNQINYVDGGLNNHQTLLLPSDSITAYGNINIIVEDDAISGHVTTKRTGGSIKGAIYSNIDSNEWVLSYETTYGQFNDVKVLRFDYESYAVGNNGLMARYVGGQWIELPPITNDDLLSVDFDSQRNGWAVGRNGTVLYFNGSNWTVLNSLTTKDLHCTSTPQYPFDGTIFLTGGTNGTLISNLPSLPTNSKKILTASDEPLTINPNPASDEIEITVSSRHDNQRSYQIIDLSGKLLLSGKLAASGNHRNVKIDIRSLKAGTYIIRVISDKLVQTGKLVTCD